MPRKVILDSNFLFIPAKGGIDIFSEMERVLPVKPELILLTPVMKEIERLATRSKEPSVRRKAVFASKLAERCRRVDFGESPSEKVDDLLIRAAVEMGGIVATDDSGLRRRLRAIGLPVIYSRAKSHLVLEGYGG